MSASDRPIEVRRLLVANRGEIARRIFRTCRRLGIETVAVYGDPDRRAPHVADADHATALYGTTPAETYLDIAKLVDAARRTNADAVHPGYGFLAENADFARAVIDAGLVWVGPSPAAIAAMADKLEAKRIMTEAGVPVLPSAVLEGDDVSAWQAAAEPIGYPLLVKASAGGGGKGMRRVGSATDLRDAVESGRREAASAFGDPTLFAERLLERPRHVEVQVLGDHHGSVEHLGTRDCSVQRRHQKVIEEAPAPDLSAELRSRLHESGVTAAKAIGYTNAGTVEFLVSGDECFFVEMNTRLQVEHPVTEEIYGIDLVEEQLRIARGHPLERGATWNDDEHTTEAHAIEARIYAEDPTDDFLPAIGRVERFTECRHDLPVGVRIESGIAAGFEITSHYDPMLAKVIACGDSREAARRDLARALRMLEIHGVTTNRDLLVAVLEHEAFAAEELHTAFLDDHPETLNPQPPTDVRRFHAIAATLALRAQRAAASPLPYVARAGWRNVASGPAIQRFTVRDDTVEVAYGPPPRAGAVMPMWVDGEKLAVVGVDVSTDHVDVEIDGVRWRASVHSVRDHHWVNGNGWQTELVEVPRFPYADIDAGAHGPIAPMPGTVAAVQVSIGDSVEAGQTLVVLEAMKMEHRLVADSEGVVSEVRVAVGEQVDAHQLLVVIEPTAEP